MEKALPDITKLDDLDEVMYGNAFSALRYITLVVTEFLTRGRQSLKSAPKPKKSKSNNIINDEDHFEEPPLRYSVAGYVSYVFLFVVGYVREFIWGSGPLGKAQKIVENEGRKGYAPLYTSFESFYTRNIYRRL